MKNFRSNYYEKVGFKAVDVKKALESMLNESVIDKEKLSQFTLKYDLPFQYRTTVWKILLDIISCNHKAAEFVWQQRVEQYDLLLRGLRTMKKIDSDDRTKPDCKTMSLMFALEENKLHLLSVRASHRPQWEMNFEFAYNLISEMTDDSVEIYWICRNVTNLLAAHRNAIPLLVQETEKRLSSKEPRLNDHVQKLGFWKSSALSNIFQSAMAGVFNNDVALRVWDKIIAGSVVVQVFVAIECLITLEARIMSIKQLQTAERENIAQTIRELPVSSQVSIVDRAMEAWTQIGCPTSVKTLIEETNRRFSFGRKMSIKHTTSVK